MPPSTDEEYTAAAWDNIVAALQDRPCRDALAGLDPHKVVAMRLLEGGELSAVTSDHRRMIDYMLAVRILLHQTAGSTAVNRSLRPPRFEQCKRLFDRS